MRQAVPDQDLFGREKIGRIFLKLAPPVMLAQLIQALYNIVDSFFIGRFSDAGLAALSIIFPIQLLMIALAVGTGVGLNTAIAAALGTGRRDEADRLAGVGTPVALVFYALFAAFCWFFMPTYAAMSSETVAVAQDVVTYGRITSLFSIGLFLESMWTKVLQAEGDMRTPTLAQVLGALTNILLDPILIFGMFGLPQMGIAGAAIATVAGQTVAALVVMRKGLKRPPALSVYPRCLLRIFSLALPSILMRAAYTVYIFGLNLILAGFCDQAVTALGLYYKWQTFFFIPFDAMQVCIVPLISYNYMAGNIGRCKKALHTTFLFGALLMLVGVFAFELFPAGLLSAFSTDPLVISIGTVAFRIIGISFIPLVTSLTFPVFFQAVGNGFRSTMLTVVRTVFCFVPLGFLFSLIGLDWFWLTYPVTDTITSLVGFYYYYRFLRAPYGKKQKQD